MIYENKNKSWNITSIKLSRYNHVLHASKQFWINVQRNYNYFLYYLILKRFTRQSGFLHIGERGTVSVPLQGYHECTMMTVYY